MLFNNALLVSLIFIKPGPAISIKEKLLIFSKKITFNFKANSFWLILFFFQEPLQRYMINQN